MKKLFSYLLVIMLVPAVVLTGCKDDDDPTPVEKGNFETLKTYLVNQSLDLPNVLDSWITTAAAVNGKAVADYFIIDLRSAADYAAGHIEGAVNSTLANVLTTAEAATKPILVVCYTGQTAGHAVVALRLSGHTDAKVLKWGMCSWNEATAAAWPASIGNTAVGNANWKDGDQTKPTETFAYPSWETTSTDGATILAERVQELLNDGFNGVDNTDVLGTPANYFINNYWAATDVEHYGHIAGAYRVLPLSFADGTIKGIDPEKTAVTYCWTGQTSSMVTAYLKVLGYDAKSLKFGANGMIYDNLESHQWADTEIGTYPLVTK